jgi:hypothetical protein
VTVQTATLQERSEEMPRFQMNEGADKVETVRSSEGNDDISESFVLEEAMCEGDG